MSGVAASRVGSENRIVPRQTDALDDRRNTDTASHAGGNAAKLSLAQLRALMLPGWTTDNSGAGSSVLESAQLAPGDPPLVRSARSRYVFLATRWKVTCPQKAQLPCDAAVRLRQIA